MKLINYRCANDDCGKEIEDLLTNEEYEEAIKITEIDCSCGAKMKLFLFKNNSQVYRYLS
jgi:DNA-directed RNA polymerase subunit RPC12/RpoP